MKVNGNISGVEKITVVPDAAFNMNTSGKESISTLVTQNTTEFYDSQFTGDVGSGKKITSDLDNVDTSGVVTTSEKLTSGSWSGNLNFEVGVNCLIKYQDFKLTASNYAMAGIERTGDVVIPETFEYDEVN